MATAKNDYIIMMGEMLTEYLRLHTETEIDSKCNLAGAFEALKQIAKKKQRGGCYAMPPREVFDEMMVYFDLPHADADYKEVMLAMVGQQTPDVPAPKARPKQAAPAGDLFDLDALLEV